MSAAKHTPGPWLYRSKSDAVYTTPSDPAYQYGSQIFRFDDEEGPNEDDLYLILAAPDLLAALQDCVVALNHFQNELCVRVNPPTLENSVKAIAKATGATA